MKKLAVKDIEAPPASISRFWWGKKRVPNFYKTVQPDTSSVSGARQKLWGFWGGPGVGCGVHHGDLIYHDQELKRRIRRRRRRK